VKCREFTEFIMEYLAGTLAGETMGLFEGHLTRCDACRAYLSNYMATIEMGKQAFADENADVPPDVPEELIQAILNSRPR
jgi:predicted anti-sigma-YlaC factor YlaD